MSSCATWGSTGSRSVTSSTPVGWDTCGRNTIILGPVTQVGEFWSAIFESGPSSTLDGAAALVAAGLTGFQPQRIDISLARGARRHVSAGVDVHVPLDRGPLVTSRTGIPSVAPSRAAVNAAHWAVSRRQAALLMVLPVQQGLFTGDELAHAWSARRRGRHQRFLQDIVRDIAAGAQALSELDFSADCRRRQLPVPSRQRVRELPGRVAYLDAEFTRYGFAVEVDGSHHFEAAQTVDDMLRQNQVVITGTSVLRIPVLGYRLHKDRFLDQVERCLRAQGWSPCPRSAPPP